ncbi:MAG: hypothetical protein JWM81_301 [Candidatus Saccharibacteria bacterium]|nr:hypothetical protein [Candidatus Saccharibacteria bacterium]
MLAAQSLYAVSFRTTASVYGSNNYDTGNYNGTGTNSTTTTPTGTNSNGGVLQNTGAGAWLPLVVSAVLIVSAILLAIKPLSRFRKAK